MMTEPYVLCQSLPREFFIIMEYVKNMHYTADVDYDFIESNF